LIFSAIIKNYIFERVCRVDVLQTLQSMFSTCPLLFVARWAGSYDALLPLLAFEWLVGYNLLMRNF